MIHVANNTILLGNIIAKHFSKYPSDDIFGDSHEIFVEIGETIKSYTESLTIDKRAIAVASDFHPQIWTLLPTREHSLKELLFINLELFSQSIATLLRPAKSLIAYPDRNMLLVAVLNNMSSDVTFFNDQSLFNFEKFIINHPLYKWNGSYNVIDYQEIVDETFSEKYDFIFSGAAHITPNEGLLTAMVNSLNPGGCLLLVDSGDSSDFYTDFDYVNLGHPLHDIIDNIDNINNFHVPYGIGFNIIVKK